MNIDCPECGQEIEEDTPCFLCKKLAMDIKSSDEPSGLYTQEQLDNIKKTLRK